MPDTASLLLVTHVPLRHGPRGLQIDDQTAAGIAQWRRHFDSVGFYGIRARGDAIEGSSTSWVDAHDGALGEGVRLHALPWAYRPAAMAAAIGPVRAELRRAIAAHRHLCFTLGGIVGDWASLGAWEAMRQKRRFAVWIDRVEPDVIRAKVAGSPLRRIAAELAIPVMQTGIRHLVRNGSVALLQGGDTFAYYARSARDPHCTYDTHTHADAAIDAATLAAKQARVRSGAPLAIVYVGRAAAMKGPFDWIATLERLDAAGVPFRATWIGDGPDLPAIRARVAAAGLADRVALPGYEGDRDRLLAAMRAADLLLFCHKTPESARCLIESLVCGCPLVGFDSAYPRGLVADGGGGVFVPRGDVAGLAAAVAALHADRAALSALIGAAARSGTAYTEDAVYAHRAGLMRRG